MVTDKEKEFFDNILESVIAIDKEGKIRELNQAALKSLGYKRKEDIIALSMEKICKGLSLKEIRDKAPLQDAELIYLSKEGKEIPVRADIIRRLSYPDDIVFMARDMSKTKELIDELRQSKEEFKSSYAELQDSKDELVRSEKLAFTGRIAASLAHEIRNPLTNVAMSVQQLKKTFKPDGPQIKHVEIITNNIGRANHLITELINCARPPKLNLQPYNVHNLLKSILESTKVKLRFQKVKAVKRFTTKASIIKMDKEQLERAFLNLVSNAVEAMPKGGMLTIVTELNGNFFRIKIQDTGKGIPEENIIKIFDPFFSTRADGVGLGLTVCYGIIVSHGGTIEVESKPKEGSVFTVSLPMDQRFTHTHRERERERERVK